MKLIKNVVTLCLCILLISCFSTETEDADKAYQYWSGSKPPKEIELIKGQWYQSPHFTLEYEFFLKFKSDRTWFNEFVEYNNLKLDTTKIELSKWTEFPIWFQPNKKYLMYSKNLNDEFERSRYFIHPTTGICYIYDTVGM